MIEAPAKLTYFKGRVIFAGRTVHYVVWDGVEDYSHAPPVPQDGAAFYCLMQELRLSPESKGDFLIAQIRNHKFGNWHLEKLIGTKTLAVVIWARDHATFRAIVANLERESARVQ
jgi:hypothetical protein